MNWDSINVDVNGTPSKAITPLIISASRSTDIPAFYSDWLIDKIQKGYCCWINPFNRKKQYISFSKCKAIVFWTKNPEPIIRHLPFLDSLGIAYYFQYTLNDYEKENLEPCVPSVDERIETFIKLSKLIGKERVIWRFDPILFSDSLDHPTIIERIKSIGDIIHQYTSKLVFSFADIACYRTVSSILHKENAGYKEPTQEEAFALAQDISKLNSAWSLELGTCAEKYNFENIGISHNRCIDDCLLGKISRNPELLRLFSSNKTDQLSLFNNSINKLKDTGQRKECGCIISKDIGQYNTCFHHCKYCYANHSLKRVNLNASKIDIQNDSITGE